MEFKHTSVLLEETIEHLNIKSNGVYVDCTLGGGGHSGEILKKLDKGFLYAFDQDELAISSATKYLNAISDRYEIIKSNFVNLRKELLQRKVTKVDGIIFDLGVSSPQFDNPIRGFSYNYDARLDMRMDNSQELSAYEVVNYYSFQDLLRIISRYGEENFAKNIAREIEKERKIKPIETTFELVEIIKKAIPAKFRREKHPAKKTFQALRIEVNKELDVLPVALHDAISLLNVGGRICVITFHSLEDRITKDILRQYSTKKELPRLLPVIDDDYIPVLELINRKVILASESELEENSRAHSAKLRVAEKKRDISDEEDINSL